MSNNYVTALRKISPEVENLKIKRITLTKKGGAYFDCICDKAVSLAVKNEIEIATAKVLPEFFVKVVFNITKIVADGELVAKEIMNYLWSAHMSVAHSINLEDISATVENGKCEYVMSLDSDIYGYFGDNDVCDDISEHLEEVFCETFVGKTVDTGKTKSNTAIFADKINSADYETIKCRTFEVTDVVKLWGEEISPKAVYIADAELVSGNVTFAGVVVSMMQKETKKGKIFHILELDDKTGKIQVKIFMTKEKEKKMEKINVGSKIIVKGELSLFNGMPSFKVDDLSYCELPLNFEPKERESKSVPSVYSIVKPEPMVEVTQSFLFTEEKAVEPCLMGKTFVVLDIETTGVHYVDGDMITEIGAVRIVDGKIVDKFQTFVNPKVKISEEITKLTGITDDMVADAPTIDKVIPDLFKYVDGAYIVAHNIDFDYKFIKHLAKPTGYIFKNEGIDTLAFSRAVIPRLKNYKLNTVCGHFGIEFLHHRAFSDAYATAKLFIELVAIKKSLPI